MATYFKQFDVVEVQNTFYQPPQISTLKRWRAEASVGFEFTLKAWQLITHQAKSPTYRRLKRELSEREAADAGSFRDTTIVREAWEVTRECAEALGAKRILFQCPGSFKPSDRNLNAMRHFFESLDRGDFGLLWEPRGKEWTPELVSELCRELQLLHVVDPFVNDTETPEAAYFRLHGKGGWRYKYTAEDLDQLMQSVPGGGLAYVMFNNVTMREDALRFLKLLNRS